jgi:hypothetical protein
MLNFNELYISKNSHDVDTFKVNRINLEELYEPTDTRFEYLVSLDLMGKLKPDEIIRFDWETHESDTGKNISNVMMINPVHYDEMLRIMRKEGLMDSEIRGIISGTYWGPQEYDIDRWQQFYTSGHYHTERQMYMFNRKTDQVLKLNHFRRWSKK